MFKKYKLIKWFPESPPVGTIYTELLHSYSTAGCGLMDKMIVEGSPEFWERIKEPILTTEDGVDLYKNNYFWHVDQYFSVSKGVLDTTCPEFSPSKGYKHFSTEKAAKDWIEMNKPIYSMKDILMACTKKVTMNMEMTNCIDFDKLKK